MSRILIVSDNHGDHEILETIVARESSRVDRMLHLGDSELKNDDPIWKNFDVVTGNVDFYPYPEALTIDVPEGKLFMTHGHLYNVRSNRQTLAQAAKAAGASIALFGHIHVTTQENIDGVWCINPGSISQPRGHFQTPTYGIIDWNAGQRPQVTFYSREGEEIIDSEVPENTTPDVYED
ncbi:MAG: YfcE family phosphodiesterase [Aerococcus sp.]|nr:YfcE family phosphodiesterase [Aerococcus sp.]